MARTHIICLGASTLYGVGGDRGGWPDLLKQELHTKMYSEGRVDNTHQVYNLGIPEATLADMLKRLPVELPARLRHDSETIVVFHPGSNDTRAEHDPKGFISTPDEYQKQVDQLLAMLRDYTDRVVVLGMSPVDEMRLNPLVNPVTGLQAFYGNDRIRLFEDALERACIGNSVVFEPLLEKLYGLGWLDKYISVDGLHPNGAGHERLYQYVLPLLQGLLRA